MDTERGRALAHECVGTPAFADNPTRVLYVLDNQAGSLVSFATTVLAASSRFAGDLADASRDTSRGLVRDTDIVGRLLLRLYEEAEADSLPTIHRGCLAAWDALLQARVGVRNMFEA